MTLESMSGIYYNKGLELFKNSNLTGAVEAFKRAIEFNVNNWAYYNAMGLCLYNLGKFNEAKKLWEESIKIHNSEENLAVSYLEAVEEQEFKNMLEKYNEAYTFSLNKNYKEAINIILNNNLRKYSIVIIENFYGLCNYAIGNKNEAIKAWRKVLQIDSANEQALRYLSDIWDLKEESKGILGWLKGFFNK